MQEEKKGWKEMCQKSQRKTEKYAILLHINDRKHQMPCYKIESFFSSTVLAGLGGDMSNSFYDPCTFLLIAKHNSNEENISNYS